MPKTRASILVSYRMEGKDLGKGAFYDHYTLQHHTKHPTVALLCANQEIRFDHLSSYALNQPNQLPIQAIPKHTSNYQNGNGLLFIPGMTRDSYNKNPNTHSIRITFEKTVIQDALNRGRPILAVCAGSWTLWETLSGNYEDSTVKVNDHNYGGAMARISPHGYMTHNKLIHDVIIQENSLLQKSMNFPSDSHTQISVNSVHWRAPSGKVVPPNFRVSAQSAEDSELQTIKTRRSTIMTPEPNTVEAYESIAGAPVLGIQWHPEAFDWDSKSPSEQPHQKCLLFMAKAGDAFAAKQRTLKELKKTLDDRFVEDFQNLRM